MPSVGGLTFAHYSEAIGSSLLGLTVFVIICAGLGALEDAISGSE